MTSRRQAFEMVLSVLFALVAGGILYPFVPTHVSATAGGVVAATYFFSRYPWGGRPETNDQLDAFMDDHLRF